MANLTNDRTFCCSSTCKKRFECAIHYLNSEGVCIVEDYSNYGSGVISTKECKVEYWCGELGDYKMFESKTKIEDVVVRDFSTNEYTFDGRNLNLNISDEEIEKIADKMDRVNPISPEELRKILKIHHIKT